MNTDAMLARLIADEALRLDLYDDDTGKTLKRGDTIKGHPTIAIGRALDVYPLTREEAVYLSKGPLEHAEQALDRYLAGWREFSDARQIVLVSMVYQMGWGGVSKFVKFLAAVRRGDFNDAAEQILDSSWHVQTPARAERLAAMMRSG